MFEHLKQTIKFKNKFLIKYLYKWQKSQKIKKTPKKEKIRK